MRAIVEKLVKDVDSGRSVEARSTRDGREKRSVARSKRGKVCACRNGLAIVRDEAKCGPCDSLRTGTCVQVRNLAAVQSAATGFPFETASV